MTSSIQTKTARVSVGAARCLGFTRHREKTWKEARDLQARESFIVRAVMEDDGEVHAQIGNMRKGMGGVEASGVRAGRIADLK